MLVTPEIVQQLNAINKDLNVRFQLTLKMSLPNKKHSLTEDASFSENECALLTESDQDIG